MNRARILIVEDDSAVLETYKLFLEIEGFDVVIARNGKEALDELRAAHNLPALILLDLMMPVMSGWEFLEARRTEPRMAAIPVIAISSARFPEQPIGVVATLLKPVDIHGLVRLIREHLGRSHASLPERSSRPKA